MVTNTEDFYRPTKSEETEFLRRRSKGPIVRHIEAGGPLTPTKLRLLAWYLDKTDPAPDHEVQEDLRRWADEIESGTLQIDDEREGVLRSPR